MTIVVEVGHDENYMWRQDPTDPIFVQRNGVRSRIETIAKPVAFIGEEGSRVLALETLMSSLSSAIRAFPENVRIPGLVFCDRIAVSSQRIAYCMDDGTTVGVWEGESSKEEISKKEITLPKGHILQLGISLDGSTLYVACESSDHLQMFVCIYSLETLVLLHAIDLAPGESWWNLEIKDHTLLRAHAVKVEVYYHIGDRRAQKFWPRKGGLFWSTVLSNDGKLLCTKEHHGVVYIWKLDNNKNRTPVYCTTLPGYSFALTFSGANRALLYLIDTAARSKEKEVMVHWFFNRKELFELTAAFFSVLPPYLILQLYDAFYLCSNLYHYEKIGFILAVQKILMAKSEGK